MKNSAAKIVTCIANHVLTRLRNKNAHTLSRDEIRFMNISFSQFGEDISLRRRFLLSNTETNVPQVYVDAGCYHPVHFSNTLLLHKVGWRGVNVDLDSSRIEVFRRVRPNDHSVVAALSDSVRQVRVTKYAAGVTDRIVSDNMLSTASLIGESPLLEHVVTTRTLNEVIESSPWPISRIGYLNVDCEGHDLAVLKGFDLAKYRPSVVTAEASTPEERAAIASHLAPHGYSLEEIFHRTLLFVGSF